ncbi:MAG: V4R domain-containing protein [Candidatus Gagatemarchaeaceae archaeon]
MAPRTETEIAPVDALPPKVIMVYHLSPRRKVLQGSFWLRDVPGTLAAAAGQLARSGANLVATSSTSLPGTDLAEWSFFAEEGDDWRGLKKMQESLEESPGVVKTAIREGREGMVVGTLHYPLRLSTGEQAMVLGRKDLRGMFDYMLSVFGSGGRVMVYEQGVASRIEAGKHFWGVIGRENFGRRFPDMVSLYGAHGWGRVELVNYSAQPLRVTARMYDCFECVGGTSSETPKADFVRGHVVGSLQTMTGRPIECEETKCVSIGDAYCQFEIREKSPG